MLTQAQLIKKARMYLQDALNTGCSTHTRYSAVMSCLQCLCLADIAESSDRSFVEQWETTRYDVDGWPDEGELEAAIDHVRLLLGRVNLSN